jgi:hypothetical protein
MYWGQHLVRAIVIVAALAVFGLSWSRAAS